MKHPAVLTDIVQSARSMVKNITTIMRHQCENLADTHSHTHSAFLFN